jgi:hypothetical protein
MATIKIGCTLPHGLVLDVRGNKVTLNGANQYTEFTRLIGTHGTTDIDASFWEAWKKENAENAAFVNGFIFETKDESSAKSKVKDIEKKTGFEQLAPDSNGVETDKA